MIFNAFEKFRAGLFKQKNTPSRPLRQQFSDSLIFVSLQHYRWVSLGRCVSVEMSRGIARSREVRTFLLSSDVTAPHHRCSVANMAWDPLASVGRMRTIFGFWLVVQPAPTFISHVPLRVYRKLVSMSTTYRGPAVVPMFLVVKCLRPTRIAVDWETDITYSFGGTDGLVAPSNQRSGDGARQWSRCFSGTL